VLIPGAIKTKKSQSAESQRNKIGYIFCSFCFCAAFLHNDDDDDDDDRMTGAMMLKFVMLMVLNTVGI